MLTTHLSMRVAWHDHDWDGTVCRAPCNNSFCVALDRVREQRRDDEESRLAGVAWADLEPDRLPPCARESGGFMSPNEWTCVIRHPYATIDKLAATHGHLLPTPVTVPPYSSFAVPFWWMLKSNQGEIEQKTPEPLPPDQEALIETAWIFSADRQRAVVSLFFDRLREGSSLVMYYTKEGQPLDEDIGRLVVGVGTIAKVHPIINHRASREPTYPEWDRLITHSIRPEGSDGVLLPYHAYLEPTGDPDEDARRKQLLREIAVVPEMSHLRDFSYAAELIDSDVVLATLKKTLDAVRAVRKHGIAQGPWAQREEWVNDQIARTWEARGAYPGLGACLEAIGLRCGTSMMLDLADAGRVQPGSDPWDLVDAILRGREQPPKPSYRSDLQSVAVTWHGLQDERRTLLKLLSHLSLSRQQAVRWFDPAKRASAIRLPVSDADLLANPYLIAELDLGDEKEGPVAVGVIDRGMLPDDVIAAAHPIPEPSAVDSLLDQRRVRAALVGVLREAAEDGDSLLNLQEAMQRLEKLALSKGCHVPSDWVLARRGELGEAVQVIDLPAVADTEPGGVALQLSEYATREADVRKIILARIQRELVPIQVEWRELLIEAIAGLKEREQHLGPRELGALAEQEEALSRVTSRKLSVIAGRAGTGKTSVVGALLQCPDIVMGGVLLLAPTGKARVRLARATGADEARTIAQFLNGLGRYDAVHQRPLFSGKKFGGAKTVVIDECSMLTLDDLAAVFAALDMTVVDRLILVGDPSQLPPIGVGRPFADLVGYLEQAASSEDETLRQHAAALGLLTVEVRSVADEQSDALRLAAWFSRDALRVDADFVLADLETNAQLNDLEVRFWESPEDLKQQIIECFQKHLGLHGPQDVDGFNRALGIREGWKVPLEEPDYVESFQVLSPVRMHPWGVYELNRWVQERYRAETLTDRRRWHATLGTEEIVRLDKVIQLQNQKRSGYDHKKRQKTDLYLANGEIGLVMKTKNGYYDVAFAGRPNVTAGYSRKRDFLDGSGPLELAYALTVHKAQGSEFGLVFVVIPQRCRLISRELLYTALTRSRQKLVLLVQGEGLGFLHELTLADRSETARRNTRLFSTVVRETVNVVPFADYLIHRTLKGDLVRSKSELVIANVLHDLDIDYQYEQRLPLPDGSGSLLPDFSFATPAGDRVVWEHLGMLSKLDYKAGWQKKLHRYEANGYRLEENLFATEDDSNGGLDSQIVEETAERVRDLL